MNLLVGSEDAFQAWTVALCPHPVTEISKRS